MKYVIVIEDGASDYPIKEINNLTPFKIANKPELDNIAKKGKTGLIQNIPEGLTPGSDVANMSIFGYDPLKYYTGRAPLEAISMGVKTLKNDVIFRCNTITEKNDLMISSNANHISSKESAELMNYLNKYFNKKYSNFKGKFYPGISYRNLFIYNDPENSEKLAKLTTTPPHDFIGENIKNKLPTNPHATNIKNIILESKKALTKHPTNQKKIKEGKNICNMIWLWGQGTTPNMPKMKDIYGLKGAVITGVDLIKGLGKCSGCTNINVPGATAFFDTNYKAKGKYATKALEKYDITFIHIESPDEAGHAKNLKEKIKAIEQIDKWILKPIMNTLPKYNEFKIAVLPDHPTPIKLGTHTKDMVPIAIYSTTNKADNVQTYDENSVKNGTLGKLTGNKLLNLLLKQT